MFSWILLCKGAFGIPVSMYWELSTYTAILPATLNYLSSVDFSGDTTVSVI